MKFIKKLNIGLVLAIIAILAVIIYSVNIENERKASKQEIIRRYFKTGCEYKKGYVDKETFEAAKLIMEQVNLKEEDRNVVLPARKRAENLKETVDKNEIVPVIALELEDGTIITGRNTETLDSSASDRYRHGWSEARLNNPQNSSLTSVKTA